MVIQISFKHMSAREEVKAYAEEKTERLKKYFDGKIHVIWNLTVEHDKPIAHCHLIGNHMDYFGEAEAETLMAAIDLTIDKVEKQIRKHKEKLTNKLHQH